jgi:hypothetical protein
MKSSKAFMEDGDLWMSQSAVLPRARLPRHQVQACIAQVIEAREGLAVTVSCEQGDTSPQPVMAHASQLPDLYPGDRVLVIPSASGLVVTQHLLIDSDELPRAVSYKAAERFVIRCGSSHIELSADGQVLIKGDMIQQRADGRLVLKGGRIELN